MQNYGIIRNFARYMHIKRLFHMLSLIKRYPLSLLCIALVWYLSIWVIPPEEMELPSINFLDKWTHFVMYGGTCAVIWWEYLRSHHNINARKLILWALMAPTVMGGVIELVQSYCTTNRSGEWLDLAADAIGVLMGAVMGLVYRWLRG